MSGGWLYPVASDDCDCHFLTSGGEFACSTPIEHRNYIVVEPTAMNPQYADATFCVRCDRLRMSEDG